MEKKWSSVSVDQYHVLDLFNLWGKISIFGLHIVLKNVNHIGPKYCLMLSTTELLFSMLYSLDDDINVKIIYI